jgi:hypothetical protein
MVGVGQVTRSSRTLPTTTLTSTTEEAEKGSVGIRGIRDGCWLRPVSGVGGVWITVCTDYRYGHRNSKSCSEEGTFVVVFHEET